MDIIDKYIPSLPFYNHLSDSEKTFVRENMTTRKYSKGDIIYSCGGYCLGMTYIVTGKIRVYIVSDEGREITLYSLFKNDTCVMSASCVISQITFETLMTAEEDCEILVLASPAFSRLSDTNIYVKEYMYELATKRFSEVMWVMQEILFYGFDRRLARFLVGEYERNSSPEIRMTQEEIAKNVNSAREVVARMLKRFSGDGLIDVKHGTVIIKNIDGLKKLL